MYTINGWGSHLGSVRVDSLKQKPARTVVGPITAYVSEGVTQVQR